MALDGAFLYLTAAELREVLLSGENPCRVEKIAQPSREELMITLRLRGGSRKLLFSANANSPRLHFTELSLENPKQPPMFCMLLRKHIGSGKLTAVRQNGLDRVLTLDFETINELGDSVTVSLVTEIMGRHSNIILVNHQGKIVDAIKRVTDEVSSVRLVLPGITYRPPPAQDKLNLLEAELSHVMSRFDASPAADPAKALMGVLEGISPLLAREVIHRALKGQELPKNALSAYYKQRISEELETLRERLRSGQGELVTVVDDAKKLRDFTLLPVEQYGSGPVRQSWDSPSRLLDSFYADRDQVSRMKQRSHDLLKLLVSATDRITRKLALQKEELLQCGNREQLRIYGDLINSNLYRIEKGDRSVQAENFYDEGSPLVEIPLDPRLTPSQNAQKYYGEYRKAATAEEKLKALIREGEQELLYLDSVFDAVSRTQGESELLEIREELAEQGYVRSAGKKQNRMLKAQPPLRYRSSDGFSILCGRNNKQNDQLTLKTARNYDLWLHTQGIAGSHVILETEGRQVSNQAIEEAAVIAAWNSKARDAGRAAVDYTLVKNVKKPNGAKPGMVIFTDYQTAYVSPDGALAERLAVKESRR